MVELLAGPHTSTIVALERREGDGAAHNAVETVQNTYVDAGVQVFINICVQQVSFWGRKHPLSRFLAAYVHLRLVDVHLRLIH